MCKRVERAYSSTVSLITKVLAAIALVGAAIVAFIGVTLEGGGLLERGLLFVGAAALVWLATRLQRRTA